MTEEPERIPVLYEDAHISGRQYLGKGTRHLYMCRWCALVYGIASKAQGCCKEATE